MFVFLKAILRGGARSDLFAAPVDVKGYVTKDGTYVAPHHSTRHKAPHQAEAHKPEAQPDLFSVHAPARAEQLSLLDQEAAPETATPKAKPEAADDGWTVNMPADLRHLYATRASARKALQEARAAAGGGRYGENQPAVIQAKEFLDQANDAVANEEIATRWCKPSAARSIRTLYGVPDACEIPETYESGERRPRAIFMPGSKDYKLAIRWVDNKPVFAELALNYGQGSGSFWQTPWGGKSKMDLPAMQAVIAAEIKRQADHAARIEQRIEEAKPDTAGTPEWTPGLAPFLYTTAKGKLLRGVIRSDLTEGQARAIDEYTFKPKGQAGWFIREKHVPAGIIAEPAPEAAPEPDPAAPPASAPTQLASFGVTAGVTVKQRRAMNAAAVDLLKAKTDAEMTDADRAKLALYSGNGGCGDSLNEFYTDPDVARSMWSMLDAAGFKGGNVLEPSCGTGVFLHTAPPGARVTGVELDGVSARIAHILHGPAGHTAENASLERFATMDGQKFAAVIGNVPFGLRGELIKDDKPHLATAERYFVDTCLDKLEDGGVLALIVPTGIMDSSMGRSFRETMLRKAEFLGAKRLPNTAFEASHTGVTSDIIMLRKRPADIAGALRTVSQAQMRGLGVWDDDLLAGSYFTDGRGQGDVMGKLEPGWRAKAGMGNDITVSGSMAGVADDLAKWKPDPANNLAPTPAMQDVLASFGDDEAGRARALNASRKPAYQVAKVGDLKVVDGVRYILQGDPPRWHKTIEATSAAVLDAMPLAELLDDLHEGRAKDAAYSRAQLIEGLDEWVQNHGAPSSSRDLLSWLAAPTQIGDAPLDQGAVRRMARMLGAVGQDGSYSDLVTGHKRTTDITDIDTAATKLALEVGMFTPDQLATASGRTVADVTEHLMAAPGFAVMPNGGTWTTLDEYLSGEMWPKLDAARAALADGSIPNALRERLETQAADLEKTIGPQSLDDVEILVNSGFISTDILSAFLNSRERHSKAIYTVTLKDSFYTVTAADEHGNSIPIWGKADLLGRVLNRYRVGADDKMAVERLNREFRDWLVSSTHRDAVEEKYNRTYRGFRPRDYSDAPIAIPGLNPALSINNYHWSGLRWALDAGKGIVADDVGLGKTARGLMLAKLAKVTGQAKKPTFVVPKSVLANWAKEAEVWFPGSRVLMVGETISTDKNGKPISKPDTADTRRRKYHDMQQNDYDFVFISAPSWNELDVSPLKKGEYINDDFFVQRGDALGNKGDKALNKIRTAYEQAKAKRDFTDRESTIYFDDLGIDMLIMDEGHAYKNLFSVQARFGEKPMFLGGGGESNRAQDTYFKSRAMREANGNRGMYMLTATPTKNSPLEVYSMLSHIAPEVFTNMGIKNSEDFLDRFCDFKNDDVLGVDGIVKEESVCAGFKNMGELREVMKRFIMRRTAADVGLKIPNAQHIQHSLDMTPQQTEAYVELRQAAIDSHGKDATGDAHIFSIMSRMAKASIDLNMLDGYPHSTSPKIDACVAEAVKNSADGAQLIFCDHNAVHDTLVAKLVAAGVPRERIGVVNGHTAPSSNDRQKISDAVNGGQLDYVIGNTATMGEGMNLQKRTADIHHLDLPWEPASMQQRNGRGVRQGNKHIDHSAGRRWPSG